MEKFFEIIRSVDEFVMAEPLRIIGTILVVAVLIPLLMGIKDVLASALRSLLLPASTGLGAELTSLFLDIEKRVKKKNDVESSEEFQLITRKLGGVII